VGIRSFAVRLSVSEWDLPRLRFVRGLVKRRGDSAQGAHHRIDAPRSPNLDHVLAALGRFHTAQTVATAMS